MEFYKETPKKIRQTFENKKAGLVSSATYCKYAERPHTIYKHTKVSETRKPKASKQRFQGTS